MGTFKVSGGTETVEVEGDNWLAALGASLPHFGLDSASMNRLAIDVALSGVVSVRDPVNGRTFELEPVRPVPGLPRVQVALDPVHTPTRAASMSTSGPSPILPPMSFGVPLSMPVSAPRAAPSRPAVQVAKPTALEPVSPPEAVTPPPAVDGGDPAPVATKSFSNEDTVPMSKTPALVPLPPPLSLDPAPRPELAALPEARPEPQPQPVPPPPPLPPPAASRLPPPMIPASAFVEDDRPDGLVEDLFDRCFDLSFEPDVGGACRRALEILRDMVPAEAGAVLYGGLASRELSFAAAYGPAASALRGRTLPLDSGIAGFVHQRGVSLVVNDVRADARHDKSIDEASGYVTDSLLAASVCDDQGSSFGCIELLNPPDQFRDWHLEAVMVVARSLAQFVASRQES